jgi:hypothetical protein
LLANASHTSGSLSAGRGGIPAQVQPFAVIAAKWLLSHAGAVGVLVIHLVLTVIIAGIRYAQGEAAFQ